MPRHLKEEVVGPTKRFLAFCVAIFLAVLGFNLLGDGLRDALDPRFKL